MSQVTEAQADVKEPVQEFGGNGLGEFFSSRSPALNDMAVHPELLGKVREILGTRDQCSVCNSASPWGLVFSPIDFLINC